jgi:hypothetical protein
MKLHEAYTQRFLTASRGFKGLKQAIKLEFKLARYDQVCTACPKYKA